MNPIHVRPWLNCVELHQDVLSDEFSEDVFALDLGALADYMIGRELGISSDELPRIPPIYRDPEAFFRSSYITKGLKSLLEAVLGRLNGAPGNRVLKLVTPFGGGKSHTLAALLHGARSRAALDVMPGTSGLPCPGAVRVAVVDGQFFDAQTGKKIPGESFHARTVWGWMAWALGGMDGYEIIREHDQARVAPGADVIIQILRYGRSLILLDELLEYLISAGGVRVGKTTLRDETVSFLKRLTVAVGTVNNAVLVFSLQSSKRESLEYTSLLSTIDHLAGRKDTRIEPVAGDEIPKVIQHRLLCTIREPDAPGCAAEAYRDVFVRMYKAYAQDGGEQMAEEEGIEFRDRIKASYPFHPYLVDVMRERWAAIPDFQRTRGALRFLASCLRSIRRSGRSDTLLGPGDVPLGDPEARQAFFKEVGQREDFQACMEHDFVGANSRTRRIDARLMRAAPSDATNPPATYIATTILMHSFGGLRRSGTDGDDPLPPGMGEMDILRACVSPTLDSMTAKACLKDLDENCLYLHFDGTQYCFKKDPNVTLLIDQEAEAISRNEGAVQNRIRDVLDEHVAGIESAVVWPIQPHDVPDGEELFLLAYMPLELASETDAERNRAAIDICKNYGSRSREFRNGLGLAMPSVQQSRILQHAIRHLMAIERIETRWREHNLTDSQKRQLKERKATETMITEHALLKLYDEVWLPYAKNDEMFMDKVRVGGTPLQITFDEKGKARIHQRLMELLDMRHKVFGTVAPGKIIELFNLESGVRGISTKDVMSGFFSFLGFPRLSSKDVIRRTIAHGIKGGTFGYVAQRPPLGSDGRYKPKQGSLFICDDVREEEIDLDSGFLVLPEAILAEEQEQHLVDENDSDTANRGSGNTDTKIMGISTEPELGKRDAVTFSFTGNRDDLYDMWHVLANLADLAGTVSVTASATMDGEFDMNKLENGVLEPLRERGIIKDDQ